ncbi:MAG: GAF domain-containing protein [Elusimicrobiota bacterium]
MLRRLIIELSTLKTARRFRVAAGAICAVIMVLAVCLVICYHEFSHIAAQDLPSISARALKLEFIFYLSVFLVLPSAILACAGIFWAFWVSVKEGVRQMRELTRSMEAVTAERDFSLRVKQPSGDEAGDAARSFNEMAHSLELTSARRFLSTELVRGFVHSPTVEGFWKSFAVVMTSFFSCKRVSVYLALEDERLQSIFAQEHQGVIELARGEGAAGFAAQCGLPLYINEPGRDGRFCERVDRGGGFKTQNLLVFPLFNRGRLAAVVELLNKPGGFTRDDLATMEEAAPLLEIILKRVTSGFKV